MTNTCYHIFNEEHTHEFGTPGKQQLIKSNKEVSEKSKITLFTCHATSIGTYGAFRLFRVGEGEFEFVGHITKAWSTTNSKHAPITRYGQSTSSSYYVIRN